MTRPALQTRHCRWIDVRGAVDPRGRLNFIEVGQGAQSLPFEPRRLFWLHHVPPGQWRGRHAHREAQVLLVALHGSCRVHLDDGRATDTVTIDDPGRALLVGPWVWHELTDFADDPAILVIASALHEEAEYLRDHEQFRREASTRP